MTHPVCCEVFEELKYFSFCVAVKLAKKNVYNHLLLPNNNKNRREMRLLSLSVCQIVKFASKRLNFSDFKG
mgnify:CR=1 FL=1